MEFQFNTSLLMPTKDLVSVERIDIIVIYTFPGPTIIANYGNITASHSYNDPSKAVLDCIVRGFFFDLSSPLDIFPTQVCA